MSHFEEIWQDLGRFVAARFERSESGTGRVTTADGRVYYEGGWEDGRGGWFWIDTRVLKVVCKFSCDISAAVGVGAGYLLPPPRLSAMNTPLPLPLLAHSVRLRLPFHPLDGPLSVPRVRLKCPTQHSVFHAK